MGFRDGRVHLQIPYDTPTVFGNQSQPSNRKLDCVKSLIYSVLGDPRADSGGEGKSKRAEKYGMKKSKER